MKTQLIGMDNDETTQVTDEDPFIKVRSDIVSLAQAINIMNQYTNRLPDVSTIVEPMLMPNIDVIKANESLAEVKVASRKLGKVTNVAIEWDESMHFLTTIRGTNGYATQEGFSLVEGTPGRKALVEAMNILGLQKEHDKDWPVPGIPGPGQLERLIIYRTLPTDVDRTDVDRKEKEK